MENESSLHTAHVPPHLLQGDPFSSQLPKEWDIVAASYILITGIFAAIGNGDIIYMAIKRKTKLKPAELMTLNLAIFDLGISVAGKPFFVVSSLAHRWLFGWYGCCLYGWGSFFFGCGSLCTMTVVSFDRYLKICHMRYGFWIERHHAMLSLLLVWLYAAFWATMPLVGWGSYAPEPFGTSCTLNWRLAQTSAAGQSFILTILVFCLILPAGIIIFSYSRIIVKVKSSRKEISRFNKCDNNSHDILEIKLTKVAMLICGGFFIAWLPYAIVSVVSAFGKPDSVPIPVSVIPTLLAKSSPMYNPIIYQLIAWKCSCAKSSRLKVFNRMKEHYPPSLLRNSVNGTEVKEKEHAVAVGESFIPSKIDQHMKHKRKCEEKTLQ